MDLINGQESGGGERRGESEGGGKKGKRDCLCVKGLPSGI